MSLQLVVAKLASRLLFVIRHILKHICVCVCVYTHTHIYIKDNTLTQYLDIYIYINQLHGPSPHANYKRQYIDTIFRYIWLLNRIIFKENSAMFLAIV